MADTEISLVCWIVGLEDSNAFPVDILRSKTVDDLKNTIKKKNENALNHIDAEELEIWNLNNPLSARDIVQSLGTMNALGISMRPARRDIPNADKLDPLKKLSSYFPKDPVEDMVHLVVRLPYTETNEDQGPPPKRLKLGGDRSQEEHRGIAHFHRLYWGKPLDPAFTTLPPGLDEPCGDEDDPSGGVLPGDPFLDGLTRRYLVRAEYLRTFDKVKALHGASRSSHLAVITGQPGIGKSLWIDYALRRCFGDKQPVIYYLGNQILFFSDTMTSINIDISDPQYPEYTWCFVDSGCTDQLPHHLYNPLSKLFPIYVSSPHHRHWAKLDQLRKPKLIIMDPWTMAELEKASVLYPDRNSQDISERFDKAGPTARYCLEFTPGELTQLYRGRDDSINWDSTEGMNAALLGEDVNLRIGDISHPLFMVSRAYSEVPPISESDEYVIGPITPVIRKRIHAQLRLWLWGKTNRVP